MTFKSKLEEFNHDEFYQSAVNALDAAIEYDEPITKEQTTLLIALTNSVLALYLLVREEIEKQEKNAEHAFSMMRKQ